ncbi:hypothetical protein CLAIMM_10620 isoform 2, partial [Cladophialophora immunda]
RLQGQPSPPTPSCDLQGSSSAQPAHPILSPLDSPATFRLQTWNWPESQTHVTDNQSKRIYEQSAQQAIAAPGMQGQQYQTFSADSNLYPRIQIEYPPRPRSDGSVWNTHAQRSYPSQPQPSLLCPYPYQYQCSQSSMARHSGGYGTLALYGNNHRYSTIATSTPYPQSFSNLPPPWEITHPRQSPREYTYLC